MSSLEPSGKPPRRAPAARRALFVVLAIVAGMFGIWFGVRLALGTETPFFVVVSSSMYPTLQVDDIIVVQGTVNAQDVKRGSIIVFHAPYRQSGCSYALLFGLSAQERCFIVHRVHEILSDGESRVFVTKGDNNPAPDSWRIGEKDFVGTVAEFPWGPRIPQIGVLARVIAPPYNYMIIALVLATIFLTELYNGPAKPTPTSKGPEEESKSA